MPANRRLIADTILLGLVGGLAAQLFVLLLGWSEQFFLTWLAQYQPPGLPEEGGVLKQHVGPYGLWLIPVSTTLGGLISGVLVYSLAPEAEGHGTDGAVKAFHREGGFIRYRVPVLKMVASAVTIGSGGSAGREGPTALIAAGFGSVYASVLKRSDEERRLLVLIGMAAGLSAIFRSPVGCAVFAVEVLYRDMEYESSALIYAMLAAVTAYVVNGMFVGWEPLFRLPANLGIAGFADHLWCVPLGLAAGITATIIPVVFYGTRDLFHRLPGPPHIKPALGGLGLGLLALWLPEVLGGGYGWIQEAIDGRMVVGTLAMLVVAKIVALSLTVSSGGSGGIFAPCLFVGAMLGAFFAESFDLDPAAFSVVGIVAVFGAAARVPFATLLMVVEMTGGFHVLPPAALALGISYMLQERLSTGLTYPSLYEAQVATRSDSPAHRAEHLRAAISMLHAGVSADPATVDHLNLVELIRSGVPIDLPGGKSLALMEIGEDDPFTGMKPTDAFRDADPCIQEIIALLRDDDMLLRPWETECRAGDRLLVILGDRPGRIARSV